jgi:hexosaminidase
VENQFSRFDLADDNISKAVFDPIVTTYYEGENLMCAIKNSIPETEIFYTIDNTFPVKFGIKYTKPFLIPEGDFNLQTQTFRKDKDLGRTLKIHRTELEKRAKK